MRENTAIQKDIFDMIEEQDKPDILDEIEAEDSAVENLKEQVGKLLEQFDAKDRKREQRALTDDVKEFIKSEISKIKPKQNFIENVIERTIQTKVIEPKVFHVEPKIIEAPPPPPQIIKELRVEVQVEKKDKTKYVEESKYLDLLTRFSKLERKLEETQRMAESPIFVGGGSGVIGIPPPEPNPAGYVLTVNSDRKAQWKAATGGTGAGLSGYTVNNQSELKTFDVTDTSLDELARVVGSIITDLQA